MPAKLKLIKTLWGIDEPISPALFESIRNEGYAGVEIIRLAWIHENSDEPNPVLIESLNHANLHVVCQIHTGGGYITYDTSDGTGEYVYCGEYDVAAHFASFQKQLNECVNLLSKVEAGGFVNVHAGVDAWSSDEAIPFLKSCLDEIQTQTSASTTVTFETHRQRLFGSPFQTQQLLSLLEKEEEGGKWLKDFKLNADLSHWYCACERVFDANDKRDAPWWPLLVDQVAQRCHYIHARLGWAQGPQMADPSAPECQKERDLQVYVWKRLLTSMKQNRRQDSDDDDGEISVCYASPEYGPPPYLPVVPHTQTPVASLPGAVEYTKKLLETIFDDE